MKDKVIFVTMARSHKGGGVFEVVYQLGAALLRNGVDIEVTWRDGVEARKDKHLWGNTPLLTFSTPQIPLLGQIGWSPDLQKKLKNEKPSIIHSHGIWMYNSYVVKEYKKQNPTVKTVITPHGMLDPWAVKNSGWKKKIIGALFENENLRSADCIHALNQSEYESVRAYGLKNPVAIIPNGIDLPEENVFHGSKEKKILLFIGRIHPKKGLSEMLDGLSLVKQQRPELFNNWMVRIAGWDQQGHIEYLKSKSFDLGLNDFVSFIGPVLGEEKKAELKKADAFILPSFSEGLPMSVLEAWSYRLPVLMTPQCNLPNGFQSNAAIQITTEPQNIADGLIQLFEMKEESRETIGENGYNLVLREYTWNSIAEKTKKLYRWLLGDGGKPDFVRLD